MAWDGTYPVRCRIVDIEGEPVGFGHRAHTPAISRPHVGKEDIAEMVPDPDNWIPVVRITLDDGTILWGYECWWEAISNDPVS